MTESRPITFGAYSRHVPASIPAATNRASARFLGTRTATVAEIEDWQAWREAASEIRRHTLQHLDHYLQMFADNLTRAGGKVHWAEDAEAARQAVLQIAREHNVKLAVKAKSMATEEIALNAALQSAGIETMETDLGEFIIQLAGTGPSHILAPAIHLTKEEIAALFREKLGIDAPPDPPKLTAIAREVLREKFLGAQMGISGANFLVAETGTLVIVTNEGNGRMCTTLPEVHVAVVGIEKVVPDWESMELLLRMLPRSATGQKISAYVSCITGPGDPRGEGGPAEVHVVLLDNGRSRMLGDEAGRATLKCIRCGACLNACPVYRQVGGFAYGWFISGPIGAIYTPQVRGLQEGKELPFASTLCGACAEICPVMVPIPQVLVELRKRIAEGEGEAPPVLPASTRLAARSTGMGLAHPKLYRLGGGLLAALSRIIGKDGWLERLPSPLNRWTQVRPLPAFRSSFRGWMRRHAAGSAGVQKGSEE